MRASELKAEVTASGSHFFDRNTMRFFDSKLEFTSSGPMCSSEGYDGNRSYFVTSEKDPSEGSKRRYTVRCFNRAGKLKMVMATVGDFQQYATKGDARKAMYAAASLVENAAAAS